MEYKNPKQICNCYLSTKGLKITEITDRELTFHAERVIEWGEWIKKHQEEGNV